MNSSKYIISEAAINEYALRMNLTITRLKKIDFGEYSCAAANAYGRADGVVTLKGKYIIYITQWCGVHRSRFPPACRIVLEDFSQILRNDIVNKLLIVLKYIYQRHATVIADMYLRE